MALGKNLKRVKKDSLIPDKNKTVKKKTPDKSISKKKVTPKKVIETKEKTNKDAPKVPSQVANLKEKILVGGKENSPLTIKLIPSRRKSVRKTKLVMSGRMTFAEAEQIKDCFISTFNDYDLIDIQLDDVKELDLIPVQMIKTFINHFPDKKIKVDSSLPLDIKIIIERAGFGSLMFKEEAA